MNQDILEGNGLAKPPLKVLWDPEVGEQTSRFMAILRGDSGLPVQAVERIIEEASEILSHCVDPQGEPRVNALLAVGRVQSGKTMSFTTVSTLARDNGFGVVILLVGTTENLRTQSEERVRRDLGIDNLKASRHWAWYSNPMGSETRDAIADRLVSWRMYRSGESKKPRPTVVITVLKHHQRLQNLADLFSDLQIGDVPVLVIDDESDQASLNTEARRNATQGLQAESGTYHAIQQLRAALPYHSFLQYTATPQANLLLAISDELNPEYATVLKPGDGYTGGAYFFAERTDLLRKIDDSEVYNPKEPMRDVPESLQRAFQTYLLVAASAELSDDYVNRSMLVQASQDRAPHAQYKSWLQGLQQSWAELMRLGDADIRAEFYKAWTDLATTWDDIPAFDDLWDELDEVWSQLRVVEVNHGGTEVVWSAARFWVLVGGQKLDRGFTVEGLVVTYMPRKTAGAVDTLQQRARFFGYREKYADRIRIFLPDDVKRAYEGYVRDERTLLTSLSAHQGSPLRSWKREFILSGGMKELTRTSVQGLKTERLSFTRGWVSQHSVPAPDAALYNRDRMAELYDEFRSDGSTQGFLSVADKGFVDLRSRAKTDQVALQVGAQKVASLLLDLELSGRDRQIATSIATWLTGAGAAVDVVFVNELTTADQVGRTSAGLADTIFSGRSPDKVTEATPLRFSGERFLRRAAHPTLHLREFRLVDSSSKDVGSVPWFAFYVPTKQSSQVIVEVLD